jgi:REP element-mobilizing transposase RayT
MRQFYLITTAHLEDKLWFMEEEDFVVGMNHVALQAASQPEVRIMAFILMSNHVHFVLNGSKDEVEEFINAFKSRYSLYLFRKHGARAHLRYNDLDIREIQI